MPTGGGTYLYFLGRKVSGVGDYRAKLHILASGQVNIAISRFTGTTEVAAVPETKVAGLTYTAGQRLQVRFVATGVSPTVLRAKVWSADTTEPSTWQVAASDSTTALQVAGSVGLANYLAGSSTNAPVVSSFQAFKVYAASTMPLAAQANRIAVSPWPSCSDDPDAWAAVRQPQRRRGSRSDRRRSNRDPRVSPRPLAGRRRPETSQRPSRHCSTMPATSVRYRSGVKRPARSLDRFAPTVRTVPDRRSAAESPTRGPPRPQRGTAAPFRCQ